MSCDSAWYSDCTKRRKQLLETVICEEVLENKEELEGKGCYGEQNVQREQALYSLGIKGGHDIF